jgi:sterol desaturase/sphingolipid hydroxylase (fatty acid hydroxylase superfamily)
MASFNETILFMITTPLFVVCIGLEMIVSNWKSDHRYSKLGFVENMYLMLLNTGLDLAMRLVAIYFFTEILNYSFFKIETPWLYWLVLIALVDLAFWVIHFIDHYCRLFWAVHVTHHSSQEYNLSVGLRSSLFEPLYRFVFFIPVALMGYAIEDIFLAYSITQLYGVFLHQQYIKSFGPLDYILVSPSLHSVHHGSNVRYLDTNMGMFFNFWDRLFGTYQKEEEPVVYGLTKNVDSHDPRTVIFHEFKAIFQDVKKAPDFKSKFMYVFGPPGWSHDGSRKTSKQLREEMKKR